MSEPFIGQISLFGFNFAPRDWAPCNGQLVPISQNSALFSLLGTQFGGDGVSTFRLPNLQGTAPIGGQVDKGAVNNMGETGGSETVTLITSTVPPHTHSISAAKTAATTNTLAANLVPAEVRAAGKGDMYAEPSKGSPVSLAPAAISQAGGSQPHDNVQPTLTANWCIALYGVYPTRS